jgi:hypothetical protein
MSINPSKLYPSGYLIQSGTRMMGRIMNMYISRLVILAIVISVLIVAVSAISAIAFQQGDTSGYKSGNTEGPNRIGTSDRAIAS